MQNDRWSAAALHLSLRTSHGKVNPNNVTALQKPQPSALSGSDASNAKNDAADVARSSAISD